MKAIIEKNPEKRRKKLLGIAKKSKGQTLILVPELHMLDAYTEHGAIFHAGLKKSEKARIASEVAAGTIQTIVGTQKALFLPFQNLTTIIIEEEQYDTYKLWDQYPRLHTVRGAHVLAQIWNAHIVTASSYPSIYLRHAIAQKEVQVLTYNPSPLSVNIIPFSFEDRKFRRHVPDEVSRPIRAWARQGKHVLVIYNKKDNADIHTAITNRLGKEASRRIHIGTTSLLADTTLPQVYRVVWLFPEFTMRTYDFRASERTRVLAARLQAITPKHPILIATRYADMTKEICTSSEDQWYEAIIQERARLHLPPFSDLVRLTVKDKNPITARQRAGNIRTILTKSLTLPDRAFGPFQEYAAKKKGEYHLLLAGNLETLVRAYTDLPIESADVDPHRII